MTMMSWPGMAVLQNGKFRCREGSARCDRVVPAGRPMARENEPLDFTAPAVDEKAFDELLDYLRRQPGDRSLLPLASGRHHPITPGAPLTAPELGPFWSTAMPGHDIIVIGASSGGVDVLTSLVSRLVKRFRLRSSSSLHVRPDVPSLPPAILNRVGALAGGSCGRRRTNSHRTDLRGPAWQAESICTSGAWGRTGTGARTCTGRRSIPCSERLRTTTVRASSA